MSITGSHNTPYAKTDEMEAMRTKAWRISLVTSILMGLISIISLVDVLNTSIRGIPGVILTAILAIVAAYSAIQCKRGEYTTGIQALLISILVSSLALPFIAEGQGIALGIIVFIITASIGTATLPTQISTPYTIASAVLAIVILLADLYMPNIGLPTNPIYTNSFAIILAAVYGFFFIRNYPSFRLRTKFIVALGLVAIIPLIILGIRSNQITRTILLEQANKSLLDISTTAATRIDAYLTTQTDIVRTEAQISNLAIYLSLSPSERKNEKLKESTLSILNALVRKNPVFISSYALVDTNGVVILDTSANDIGANEISRQYIRTPLENGQVYISPVQISPSTKKQSIYFSAPIRNPTGEIVGILRVRYNALILQNLLTEFASSTSDTFLVLIDTETFARLAHTSETNLLYKTFKRFPITQIAVLQGDLRLPPGNAADITSAQDAVVENVEKMGETALFTAPSSALNGGNALTAAARMRIMPWVILTRTSETAALAPAAEQERASIILSMLMLGLAAVTGIIAAQYLSAPITEVTRVAQQVAEGNLNARAHVNTQDEIGTLANTFNLMTYQLSDTLATLEQRINDRTADLETARAESEARATQLESIGEISSIISGEQDIEKLLPLISELVSQKFNFYHAGIFLVDNFRRYAILQAANSEGGKKMLARGHRLQIGQTGLVGTTAYTGKVRIALDVGEDATYFNNPDLPATRSEMALPLLARGRTIGVLDVQSTVPGAFNQSDARILGILADQIAIAIENARLFGQTQQALSEAQSLYNQMGSEAWKTILAGQAQIGYYQTALGGRPLEKSIISAEILQAVDTKNPVIIETPGEEATMVIPITVRNQVIGVLDVKSVQKGRGWSTDELALVTEIAGRLSFALETARLFQDARQRAEQERTITEISNKIVASNEVEDIMRATVLELQRALGASEVFVKIKE